MSDLFLDQRISIKFCVKLLLKMKYGDLNVTLKANYKVCN